MIKGLFAVVLAGSLMIPLPANAGQNNIKSSTSSVAAETLPLPPIPHAETIPWLTARSATLRQNPSILLHAGSFESFRLVLDREVTKAPTAFTLMQGVNNAGS